MPEQRDALTELVQQHVGTGKQWSTREFSEAAVDPESGWSPSKSLIGKIINGETYTVSPRLVSALAVGLGLSRDVIAAAAHFQVIGYTASELSDDAPATLLYKIGVQPGQTSKSQAVARSWADDE